MTKAITKPRARGALALAALTLVAAGGCGDSGDSGPAAVPGQVLEEARPATVRVQAVQGGAFAFGSGFVYDASEGLILTNAHVAAGAERLAVRIGGRELVPAELLGASYCDDLAVLEADPAALNAGELELSDSEVSGGRAISVGYPGSVDANSRASAPEAVPGAAVELGTVPPFFEPMLQHNAKTDPGFSGGPLLDGDARVIGVTTLPRQSGGPASPAFAIPADRVRGLLGDLEEGRTPEDGAPDLGWDLQPLSELGLADAFVPTDFGSSNTGGQVNKILKSEGIDGLWVWGVAPDSPADDAGIAQGDLITEIGSEPVDDMAEVCSEVEATGPGDDLEVRGFHVGGGDPTSFLDEWETEVTLPDG